MNSEAVNIAAMLAEPIEKLFSKQVNRETLAAAEAGQGLSRLWEEIQVQGVTLAMAPETAGGAGLGWAQLDPVFRLLGRHAAPVPLGETMLAASALALAGLEIPDGPLALASDLFQLDAQGRLSGRDALVSWAPQAVAFIVAATRDDERYIAMVPRSQVMLSPVQTYARIPSAQMTIAGVKPFHLAPSALGPLGLLPDLAVLRAAQIAGSLEFVLAQAVEHANTRSQFGQPIGKFQAIQHQLAELAVQAAAALVAVQFGCGQMDVDDVDAAAYGAAVAKQRASKAATLAAGVAHQIFGAIGVTDEHLLHYHTRRLWQWRAEAGSEHFWGERLGRQVLATGGAGLWPRLVGDAH